MLAVALLAALAYASGPAHADSICIGGSGGIGPICIPVP
jgi:hypothetical protein